MSWLLQNIPLLAFAFIVFSVVRAIKRARDQSAEHEAGDTDSDEQRRVREIQQRMRRIVAERRGQTAPAPVESDEPPVVVIPPLTEPLDPFRRGRAELESHTPSAPVAPPLALAVNAAELARQEQLAEEMRVLEEAQMFARRRAAQLAAATKDTAASEAGQLASGRLQLLQDLSDPASLRRAFVLREVLGPPVALR
jgi:hypothetical protein